MKREIYTSYEFYLNLSEINLYQSGFGFSHLKYFYSYLLNCIPEKQQEKPKTLENLLLNISQPLVMFLSVGAQVNVDKKIY
ncbi:hypothetical protein U3516DRAFT_737841 [Neocallimastix sp. 'constans']